jgi:Ca-activated chloride channel family protein
VPNVNITNKPPVDLALVVDTSGSMAGAKIVNARAAAKQLVEAMQDGDIVSIDTFSDRAETFVAPTVITPDSRERLLAAVARLRPQGSTNLFDGLSLAEAHVAQAPGTHTVRRVVVISDGIANVGPSTPDALGAIAERGLRFRAQVTSLGVGNDYDEHTLNALAIKSSGRLFHVSDPVEMTAFLKKEVELLTSTVASDAFVEVMPAPGAQTGSRRARCGFRSARSTRASTARRS